MAPLGLRGRAESLAKDNLQRPLPKCAGVPPRGKAPVDSRSPPQSPRWRCQRTTSAARALPTSAGLLERPLPLSLERPPEGGVFVEVSAERLLGNLDIDVLGLDARLAAEPGHGPDVKRLVDAVHLRILLRRKTVQAPPDPDVTRRASADAAAGVADVGPAFFRGLEQRRSGRHLDCHVIEGTLEAHLRHQGCSTEWPARACVMARFMTSSMKG